MLFLWENNFFYACFNAIITFHITLSIFCVVLFKICLNNVLRAQIYVFLATLSFTLRINVLSLTHPRFRICWAAGLLHPWTSHCKTKAEWHELQTPWLVWQWDYLSSWSVGLIRGCRRVHGSMEGDAKQNIQFRNNHTYNVTTHTYNISVNICYLCINHGEPRQSSRAAFLF